MRYERVFRGHAIAWLSFIWRSIRTCSRAKGDPRVIFCSQNTVVKPL